jgi:hypothetical protein
MFSAILETLCEVDKRFDSVLQAICVFHAVSPIDC